MRAVPPPPMTDRDVRLKLGVSIETAAEAAGVAKNTLTMWELAPERAREETQRRCAKLYKGYRIALEHSTAR